MKFPWQTIVVNDKGCRAILLTDGTHNLSNYPRATYKGEDWSCNRLSYNLNVSKIPCKIVNRKEGLILHSCDNKWCIEPSHLSLGTQSQNIKEAHQRNENPLAFNRNKPHSEETKKRLSEIFRGKKNGEVKISDIKKKNNEERIKKWKEQNHV